MAGFALVAIICMLVVSGHCVYPFEGVHRFGIMVKDEARMFSLSLRANRICIFNRGANSSLFGFTAKPYKAFLSVENVQNSGLSFTKELIDAYSSMIGKIIRGKFPTFVKHAPIEIESKHLCGGSSQIRDLQLIRQMFASGDLFFAHAYTTVRFDTLPLTSKDSGHRNEFQCKPRTFAINHSLGVQEGRCGSFFTGTSLPFHKACLFLDSPSLPLHDVSLAFNFFGTVVHSLGRASHLSRLIADYEQSRNSQQYQRPLRYECIEETLAERLILLVLGTVLLWSGRYLNVKRGGWVYGFLSLSLMSEGGVILCMEWESRHQYDD